MLDQFQSWWQNTSPENVAAMVEGSLVLVALLGGYLLGRMVERGLRAKKRAGHYVPLVIMVVTTILALAVLLSHSGLLLGLAAFAVLGFLLWLIRDYAPDVTAGLQLRHHVTDEVLLDGERWMIIHVGLLSTLLSRTGVFCRLHNRRVLEAGLHGAMNGTAVH